MKRAIYEWCGLASATLAFVCIAYWGVSLRANIASLELSFSDNVHMISANGDVTLCDHPASLKVIDLAKSSNPLVPAPTKVYAWGMPGFMFAYLDYGNARPIWSLRFSLLVPFVVFIAIGAFCLYRYRITRRLISKVKPGQKIILTKLVPVVLASVMFVVGLYWFVGRSDRQQVSRALENLKHPLADVRKSAAESLRSLGPEAKTAVPLLIEALKNESSNNLETILDRGSAARALAHVGPAAVPALTKELTSNENSQVRGFSAYALGKIGPEAKAAIPALVEALKDDDPHVRGDAAIALGSIDPEAEVAALAIVEALNDEHLQVRTGVVLALYKMRSNSTAVIPGLLDALTDENATVRRLAARALGGTGPEAKTAVPALIEALEDADSDVRDEAAFALSRIAQEANAAAVALPQ